MSMVRLLTAGKSLVGSKDLTIRYQMTDPRAMPRFGSAKTKKASAPPAAPAKRVDWLSRIVGKVTPLLARSRTRPAKITLQRLAKSPVQGELSLDKVKVVRNDLSDADVEIVPFQAPAVRPSAGLALPTVQDPEPAGTARGGKTSPVFGAANT
jgi:hypothetical protein